MPAQEAASSSPVLSQAADPGGASVTSGRRPGSLPLLIARALWAAVAIFALAVLGAKLVVLYTVLGHPSPVAQAALAQLGISPAFRTAYVLGFETLFALVFFVVAGALGRFKHDHLPALLASTAFFAFGAAEASLDVLTQVDPRWRCR